MASALADELRKKPFDLRRKEIFAFRPFNTTRFEITRGKESSAFERVKSRIRTAATRGSRTVPAEKTVDSSNFEGALLEFSNLRAEAAVDRIDPAMGMGNPAAIITVKFEDGRRKNACPVGQRGPDIYRGAPRSAGRDEGRNGEVEAALQEARFHSVR